MLHVYPATDMLEHITAPTTPAIATAPPDPELPSSQDSIRSTLSSTFSAPTLPSTSSNLSAATAAETDLITSKAANGTLEQSRAVEKPVITASSQTQGSHHHARTPCINVGAANALRTGDTTASPMLLDSPVTQGYKRTADGAVKGFGLGIDGSSTFPAAHKRNKSMDVHSATRIGELSAQLKTRLSYAMVKVQNGWEKRSLDELEEVHSQRGSPNSVPGRSDRLTFDSPYNGIRRRRPSGVSDNSEPMIMSPASDPTRSHAATPSSNWHSGAKPAMNATANLLSITNVEPESGLAPAPDLIAGRRRRSSISYAPPPLLSNNQRKHYSDLGAGFKLPATPRAGILRMPSQQAEKDAVDTLLFMSSPNNSQRFPHTGQAASTPLRAEAPQRRVMFDTYPPQEKYVTYQSTMQAPPQHQHGPYPAYPAR